MSAPRPGDGQGAVGYGFPQQDRIRKAAEIRRLLREGRRHRVGPLEVFVGPAPGGGPRFGVIVPKHGRRIVDRNRLRRRLREIGRVEVLPRLRDAGRGFDVLVRARPSAYHANFSRLRAELISLTERLCSEISP